MSIIGMTCQGFFYTLKLIPSVKVCLIIMKADDGMIADNCIRLNPSN